MLRASSVGLTSAILSAASASRRWKAPCRNPVLKAVVQQNVHSPQLRVRGLRQRAASPPLMTFRLSQGRKLLQEKVGEAQPAIQKRLESRLRVQQRRDTRRAATLRAKPGVRRNAQQVRFQRPGFRLPGLRHPVIHKVTITKLYRGLSVLDKAFSPNRAGHGQRESTHAPFKLHPRIVDYLRFTFEETTSKELIHLLRTAAAGRDLDESWQAYAALIHLQSTNSLIARKFSDVPNAVLHRLARHIARTRPVTKSHFPRLLRVLQHLWDTKNPLPVEAWNTLINCAGKGHRTGSRKEYDIATSIFHDMIGGQRPGTKFSRRVPRMGDDPRRQSVQPDLITFNTLLNIAARSLSKRSVEHAVSLFKQSGFAPDWITHMALMMYHVRRKHLGGVRATLRKMAEQKIQLPLDGANAVLWAFAYSGRNDVVLEIYRVLRNNLLESSSFVDAHRTAKHLCTMHGLALANHLKPDTVTYTVVIQATARAGDFSNAFTTLHDFISIHCHERLTKSAAPAFRAIFLGFKTHAINPDSPIEPLPSNNKWTLDSLQVIYEMFLRMPRTAVPTRSTIYWIMSAFAKTSGHDIALLQRVWLQLKYRFQPLKPTLFQQPRLRRLEIDLFSTKHDVDSKPFNTLQNTPES